MTKATRPEVEARDLKTTRHAFSICGPSEDLLSVREGHPMGDAIEQAGCMLDSAIEILYGEVEGLGRDSSSRAFGALYLLNVVKGIVISCQEATVVAARMKEEVNHG